MRKQFAILAILFAMVGGCSDVPTGVEPGLAPASAPDEARGGKRAQPLAVPVVGTVEGGTFAGTATITRLALDEAGNLVATGVVSGVATVGTTATEVVGQAFTTTAVLTRGGEAVAVADALTPMAVDDPGACDILFLDLGPISLDLLGLSLDLSQILLNLDAIPGAGNLLGNLLCVVVHLLDGPGVFLQALENILDLINNILG